MPRLIPLAASNTGRHYAALFLIIDLKCFFTLDNFPDTSLLFTGFVADTTINWFMYQID